MDQAFLVKVVGSIDLNKRYIVHLPVQILHELDYSNRLNIHATLRNNILSKLSKTSTFENCALRLDHWCTFCDYKHYG